MRILLCLVSLLFGMTVYGAVPPDPELERLTSVYRKAQTQREMNFTSMEICEYLDAKLLLLEKKLATKFSATDRNKFEDLKKCWIEYRRKGVDFRASFFEGGSIRPTVANQAYAEITKHRITDLESLWDLLGPFDVKE
ncbi:MAG: lysozyme inhibitor LprI family protein [Verrucomicrobiota bacterium]